MPKGQGYGPNWKPVKGTMSGKEYGKAVSSAAKIMGTDKKAAGQANKPTTGNSRRK